MSQPVTSRQGGLPRAPCFLPRVDLKGEEGHGVCRRPAVTLRRARLSCSGSPRRMAIM